MTTEKIDWLSLVKNRIENNQNWLCCITGQTGSGKSWWSLRFAEVLQKKISGQDFTSDQVLFSAEDFLDKVSDNSHPAGTVFIWDEFGVEHSNREWQSKQNIGINKLLQTFRYMNYIILFTVPNFGFVDSATRKLIHAWGKMKSINRKAKTSRCELKYIQVNEQTGKMYFHPLRYYDHWGSVVTIPFVDCTMPSKQLIEDYEKAKRVYTNSFYEKLKQEMEDRKEELRLKKENKDKRKKPTKRQQEVIDLANEGYNRGQIAEELDIDPSYVSRIKAAVEKKGYDIKY